MRAKRQRKTKGMSWQVKALRLAESGLDVPVVLERLRLGAAVAADPAKRQEFTDIVARGHAALRVGLALRLHHEAVELGRTSALVIASKAWRDHLRTPANVEDLDTAAARGLALIEEIKARRGASSAIDAKRAPQ